MSDPMKPLPRHVQWWRKTREARRRAFATFKTMVTKALTLAFSVLGAMLISYGVYQVYAPAGYVICGVMIWLLQWSYERDRSKP